VRQLVEDALYHTDHVTSGLDDHPPTRSLGRDDA
jgi:hypothetical protein